jgi:hypothetical protein
VKESELLRLTMDWLAAKQIMAFRMNTGAIKVESRFFRFGVPGMADVLAFPTKIYPYGAHGTWKVPMPTWLELKAPSNRQSELQWSFQLKVEAEGHRYRVIRSLEDLEDAFT